MKIPPYGGIPPYDIIRTVMTKKRDSGKTRHGLHKDGDVKVQYWTSLKKRRLLQYLAIINEKTIADIAWEGTLAVAYRHELIDTKTGGVRLAKWPEIEAVAKRAEERKAKIRKGNPQ